MSPTHLFLYKIQPVRPEMLSLGATDEERKVTSEHFEYLQGLTRAGVVLLAGRTLNTDPSSFGIVLLRAESEAAARRIMLNDPVVRPSMLDGFEDHADDMRLELVPDCGHFIVDERPELVAERALEFFAAPASN